MEIKLIEFYGDKFNAAKEGTSAVVPMKQIAENIGLEWTGQYRRAMSDPVISEGIAVTTIPELGNQPVVTIRADLVPLWLTTVSIKRVSPEVAEKVNRYRREVGKVLDAVFQGPGVAVNPNPMRVDIGVMEDLARELKAFQSEISFERLRNENFKLQMGMLELYKGLPNHDPRVVGRYSEIILGNIAGVPAEATKSTLDVSEFLKAKGLAAAVVKRFSGSFGRTLKEKYKTIMGREPFEKPTITNGKEVMVRSYFTEDRPILEQAWEAWISTHQQLLPN